MTDERFCETVDGEWLKENDYESMYDVPGDAREQYLADMCCYVYGKTMYYGEVKYPKYIRNYFETKKENKPPKEEENSDGEEESEPEPQSGWY